MFRKLTTKKQQHPNKFLSMCRNKFFDTSLPFDLNDGSSPPTPPTPTTTTPSPISPRNHLSVSTLNFEPSSFTQSTGDWAGRSANFDKLTGDPIPVPSQELSEAQREWGELPLSYEHLTTESTQFLEPSSTKSPMTLSRTELQIYPATGCAVDNLPTTRSTASTTLWPNIQPRSKTFSFGDGTSMLDISRPPPIAFPNQPHFDLTTTFVVPNSDSKKRIRVSLHVLPRERSLSGEVNVIRERQTSTIPTGPSLYANGGLDSHKLSQLINDKTCFATGRAPLRRNLEGTWRRYFLQRDDAGNDLNVQSPYKEIAIPGVISRRDGGREGAEGGEENLLRLPGNIVVFCGIQEATQHFVVEVSMLTQDDVGEDSNKERKWRRAFVRRSYDTTTGLLVDGSINHFIERRHEKRN